MFSRALLAAALVHGAAGYFSAVPRARSSAIVALSTEPEFNGFQMEADDPFDEGLEVPMDDELPEFHGFYTEAVDPSTEGAVSPKSGVSPLWQCELVAISAGSHAAQQRSGPKSSSSAFETRFLK